MDPDQSAIKTDDEMHSTKKFSEPIKGLGFVNDHLESLIEQTAKQREEMQALHKNMVLQLKDMTETVKDVEGMANLNVGFCPRTLLNLNLLLTNIN